MSEKPIVRPLTPRHVCTLALPSITGKNSVGDSSNDWGRNRFSSESSFHRKDSSVSSFDTNTGENLNISSNSSVTSHASKQSARTALTTTSSTTVPFRNTRNSLNSDTSSSSKTSLTGMGFASPKSSKVGCPLIIAFGQYLLVPTLDAHILIYSITDFTDPMIPTSKSYKRQDSSSILFEEQQRLLLLERERSRNTVEPIRIVGPVYLNSSHGIGENIPASIVDINCTPLQSKWYLERTNVYETNEDKNSEDSLLGYVVIATREGDIHLFSFFNRVFKDGNTSNDTPIMSRIMSVSVGFMGANCITFTNPGTVVIGYESGRLLCYYFDLSSKAERTDTTPSETGQSTLMWSAFFENAVHSLSFQGNINEPFETSEEWPRIRKNFLLVGLSIKNRRDSSIQSSLEVLDIDLIRDRWVASSMVSEKEAIQLENISLWPKSGMEVRDIDTSKTEEYFRRNDVYVVYASTKYEGKTSWSDRSILDRTLSVDGIVPFHTKNPFFATSFSNGNVVIMNWIEEPNYNIHYGVIKQENQVILASPCVGIAAFDDSPSCLVHRHSIVCCSRGGVVWVIPTDARNKEANNSSKKQIIMYQLPYDHLGEDDGQPRYIQGFTAGYVKMKCWRSSEIRVQPLMFHAWPGGIIDVYSCDMAMELIIQQYDSN